LTIETPNAILIVDDLKARSFASELGVNYSGTLGLILRAKQEGVIPSLKPILSQIRETNFRISESLLSAILHLANES
jgi:predicted nucleic acid-binding protein